MKVRSLQCQVAPTRVQTSTYHLNTFETQFTNVVNQQHAYVTSELHEPEQPRPRVLWEVYCGGARLSKIARSLGMYMEEFHLRLAGILTEKNINSDSCKDFAPRCPTSCSSPLSASFGAECRTSRPRLMNLQRLRQEHHNLHLQFAATTSGW